MRPKEGVRHIDGRTYGRTDIRTDGHMDGRTYGRTDLRTDGWMDGNWKDTPSYRDSSVDLKFLESKKRFMSKEGGAYLGGNKTGSILLFQEHPGRLLRRLRKLGIVRWLGKRSYTAIED